MLRVRCRFSRSFLSWLTACLLAGCQSNSSVTTNVSLQTPEVVRVQVSDESPIRLISSEENQSQRSAWSEEKEPVGVPLPLEFVETQFDSELRSLVQSAETNHPKLQRLEQETSAAWSKANYVDTLPDPVLGFNIFGNPIETAAGSQRANLSLMQMIPWLDRLEAQGQQACFDAMSLQQMYLAEKLSITTSIEIHWAKLYLLNQQQRILESNQELLKSLIDLVNARISLNQGSVGDLTLMTVEIGRIEEQLIKTKQLIRSTKAELNRLAGRDASMPIQGPSEISPLSQEWSQEELRGIAFNYHPEIAAAQLRKSAARWGIEVARLKRRPDVTLGAAWFAIDNNRPASTIVDVGQDAWSLGAQVTIPLREPKYQAMRDEAAWKFQASVSSISELQQKYDALILDLLQQQRAAGETASLYRDSIIPQAEQTLQSDQKALANGSVDLDRVIQDIRNLLTLELGYHRAISQQVTAEAQIGQAVGGKEMLP